VTDPVLCCERRQEKHKKTAERQKTRIKEKEIITMTDINKLNDEVLENVSGGTLT